MTIFAPFSGVLRPSVLKSSPVFHPFLRYSTVATPIGNIPLEEGKPFYPRRLFLGLTPPRFAALVPPSGRGSRPIRRRSCRKRPENSAFHCVFCRKGAIFAYDPNQERGKPCIFSLEIRGFVVPGQGFENQQ